jgi:hypothetical protein
MSELLGNATPSQEEPQEVPDGKIETNVKGSYADDKVSTAIGDHPVFTVDKSDFYNNLKASRQRMRFTNTNVSSYMKGSSYRAPFYVQYVDGAATYRRRVK